MKIVNKDYVIAAAVFVAMGVLNNTFPAYVLTGICALACMFAATNPDNAK